MKDFKFMWGQGQSAMITEAMLSQVLIAFDNNGKEIDSDITETLFVLSDGIFEHYMPENSIHDLEANGKSYLNKEYVISLFKGIDETVKGFIALYGNIKNKNLDELSNLEIKKILMEYNTYLNRALAYFTTSRPEATKVIVDKIKNILAAKINNKKLIDEYLTYLSTPADFDETMKERIDFFRLIKHYTASKKELENHAIKYPAMFFNTYNKSEVITFLNNRLKESKDNISKEIKRIEENIKEIKNKHDKIYSEFNNNDLRYYAKILQKSALGRAGIKQIWSGAEYLFLDLINLLQKRIGINFDDFIKCFTFTDVYNFLDKKIELNDKEISEHKQCILIHYFNKELHYYYGKDALEYKEKFVKIAEKAESKEIKGIIANKGFAKGKVRILNVSDLKQFIEDSKSFNNGEILVTTMTSPIMVSMMSKASAIITDEGGICSHAAITSREFSIPCIVGTKIATKVLKDGDLIEVDAEKGIVRKI